MKSITSFKISGSAYHKRRYAFYLGMMPTFEDLLSLLVYEIMPDTFYLLGFKLDTEQQPFNHKKLNIAN